MKKQNLILSAALAAVFSSSVVFAEAEVTGKIVHESAAFTESGIGIGAATTSTQTANSHGKDVMKTETSARIYIDGDAEELQEGATYHVELNLMRDPKGVGKYDGNESYTQRDALREAYVDAEMNDYSLRVGKQQVVWGTADGMKLLDAINPTDYSEMAQNQMEDSRIPVWMINAETDVADGGNVQAILSEAKSHKIAGLGIASGSATSHTNGNAGNAFIMKGVDSITGKVHGMMNIGPALGKVSTFFATTAGGGTLSPSTLRGYATTRVHDYVNDVTVRSAEDFNGASAGKGNELDFRGTCDGGDDTSANNNTGYCEALDLDFVSERTGTIDSISGGQNNSVTNLIDANDTNTTWDIANPTSIFEYMDKASFGTFATFVNMETEYRTSSMPDNEGNLNLRYKNTLEDGTNYSLNYMYSYDPNPYIDMHWEDADTGTKLYACEDQSTRQAVDTVAAGGSTTTATTVTRVTLYTAENNTVGSCANGTQHTYEGSSDTTTDGAAKLVLVQKQARTQNLGGSFDTAIETAEFGPVVIRGEGLYQRGVKTPVVNRAKLLVGNATEALKSVDHDYFKYVLGADITALTNMMVSAQFIQIRNLDFIDEASVNVNSDNTAVTGARYTADPSVMHLTNGFKKAEKNKEFYSLFLSKPFGASGEHRWNNIFMFEENGGKWNRLDAEFSIDDDTQATVEWNKYFGDENTQFGQLAKSSNIQVGVKYSF